MLLARAGVFLTTAAGLTAPVGLTTCAAVAAQLSPRARGGREEWFLHVGVAADRRARIAPARWHAGRTGMARTVSQARGG